MRLRLVVVTEATEEHIVGPLRAELQRLVAGLGAAGADHHLVRQALDRLGELPAFCLDVDAVGVNAPGDSAVAGDDDRDAGTLRDRHDLLREGLEGGVVHAIVRQDQRGDVAAVERCANVLGRRKRRRDQHDTAAVRRR